MFGAKIILFKATIFSACLIISDPVKEYSENKETHRLREHVKSVDTTNSYFLVFMYTERNSSFIMSPVVVPLNVDSCIKMHEITSNLCDTAFTMWVTPRLDFNNIFNRDKRIWPDYERSSKGPTRDSIFYIICKGWYLPIKDANTANGDFEMQNKSTYQIRPNKDKPSLIFEVYGIGRPMFYITEICK